MKTNNRAKSYITIFILISVSYLTYFFLTYNYKKSSVNYNIHTFYYNWYGNPQYDGKYHHWSHDILPHWSDTTWDDAGKFEGGDDIGANFFPKLGNYSSNDPNLIKTHLKMMIKAGIGVFVISWWGQNSYSDKSINKYLNTANRLGLKVIFHIEPFYKSAKEFKELVDYLSANYNNHPAIFLYKGKPFYYVYDSYKMSANEWRKVLKKDGSLSLRRKETDATFIGLWVKEDEGDFLLSSGFDGFYTYFASDGFVYGSTSSNWQRLSTFSKENDLIFIPCVGPGYIDTRIRPWNSSNTKKRDKGKYYENMFDEAIKTGSKFIGITSFNEWHEGTQIEPAISKSIGDYKYEDYGDLSPSFYILKTKELITKFENKD